ncbi:hypothetical protein HMPREF9302_10815 [Prevotella amnii DNF00058]|jgi:hypothetical protein|uniref:Uncharacterized protein n=2 Tax=Prevotella amnii TaxID=419005 RepID=A0A096CW15_9BACT|nr:hypothetical protein [uncultured Prevotella sp.]EFN91294.1 hypothetical protein HMPREF9018_0727 [Prevotella amnii CRIS 21A-A]KGF49479.1 hypothetical protein HMPREF9302_10815 [Prevotella amnii DNF00058]
MEKVRKILLSELLGLLIIGLFIVVLFETNLLSPGLISDKEHYNCLIIAQFIMQLLTIAVIPFALYLFRFPFIKNQLLSSNPKVISTLLCWGSVRIWLLCFPMILNLFYYYLFGFEVSFFYLSLILLLSIVFIFPSKKRCVHECNLDKEKL